MPFYEYQCGSCGHRLEALQKMSDDPLIDCPECNTSSLKKLISAAGFRLKGTGWYETDFKNNNKETKKDTKSDSDSTASSSSDSGTSKEKPSTKESSDSSSSSASTKKDSNQNASA